MKPNAAGRPAHMEDFTSVYGCTRQRNGAVPPAKRPCWHPIAKPVRRWESAGEQRDGVVIGFASLGDKAIKEAGSVLESVLRNLST